MQAIVFFIAVVDNEGAGYRKHTHLLLARPHSIIEAARIFKDAIKFKCITMWFADRKVTETLDYDADSFMKA